MILFNTTHWSNGRGTAWSSIPEHPHLVFGLEYAGKTVNCKVVMEPQSYDVIFDGRFMATIVHTDDSTWIQESGVMLPDAIIEEIGYRVESEYR